MDLVEFEKMDDNELKEFVELKDDSEIYNLLKLIKSKRAIKWKDRLLLQMVDKSPLTFWASDKNYIVRLWEGNSENVYRRNMLDKKFTEFISKAEMQNAMIDSISIINADENNLCQLIADFSNYLTMDMLGTQKPISIITNSMQLIDEDNNEKLYAEIGLPIDLEDVKTEYINREEKFKNKFEDFEEKCQMRLNEMENKKNELIEIINGNPNIDLEKKSKLISDCMVEFSQLEQSVNDKKGTIAIGFQEFLNGTTIQINNILNRIQGCINITTYKEKQDSLNKNINSFICEINEDFRKMIIYINQSNIEESFFNELNKKVDFLENQKKYYINQTEKLISEIKNNVDLEIIELALTALQQKYMSFIASQKGINYE